MTTRALGGSDASEGGAIVPPSKVVELAALSDTDLARWEDLVIDDGGSFFSGPLWATAWHRHFAPEAETRVGLWYLEGELSGIAAMVRRQQPIGRRARGPSLPVWTNLGSGEASGDHLGFACVPSLRRSAVEWALGAGSVVRLDNLDVRWADVLPVKGGRRSTTRTYHLALEAGDGSGGSRKLWKNIRRARRRLVDAGVSFQVSLGGEIDEKLFRELVELHLGRAASAGWQTTFTADRVPFHMSLIANSSEVHRAVLVSAHQSGSLVGGLYAFIDSRRLSYYQSGWSAALERLSLGSVLVAAAIDAARDLGLQAFDMLRGDEEYKRRFGASVVEDVSCACYRGFGGVVLRARDSASDIARRRSNDEPAQLSPHGN